MSFIMTDHGYINSNYIVRVRDAKRTNPRTGKQEWIQQISYVEGNEICECNAPHADIHEMGSPVVPATPGYFVIALYDDESKQTYTMPIVAWRVTSDTAWPICVEDIPNEWAILSPDGRVIAPMEITLESVEAYREYRIETLKQRATPTGEGSRNE